MSNTYYIGWDVGAWNCPSPKFAAQSQDCITVLDDKEKLIWAWMGNVSSKICGSFLDFINGLATDKADNIIVKKEDKIIVAIDASLGLPQNAVTIANLGDTATQVPAVIEQKDLSRANNPMIYRYTEQWIDKNVFDNKGNPPLSAIQNQIGSQATKALYALKRMGFTWNNTEYIWSTENIKAIETYPTACKKIIGQKVEQLAKQLHTLIIVNDKIQFTMNDFLMQENQFQSHDNYVVHYKNESICWWLTPAPQKHPERKKSERYIMQNSDLFDSAICALTAKEYKNGSVNTPENLNFSPGEKDRIASEGWIWIPWPKENTTENSSCPTPSKTN